jgi:exopolyphosphatase/guanosine-5'-triphosphate,3'-diphosphate pyrophosphatase
MEGDVAAVVDLGSHAARLRVARLPFSKSPPPFRGVGPLLPPRGWGDRAEPFETLLEDRVVSRLAEGLLPSGGLSEGAIEKTLELLFFFKGKMDALGATRRLVAGTSALRTATNRWALGERLSRELGLPLRVLSQEEEARLSARGALMAFSPPPDLALTADVGGGSTELSLTKGGELPWWRSEPIGSLNLLRRFPVGAPAKGEDLLALEGYLTEVLKGAFEGCPLPLAPPPALIATGGTAVNLGAMVHEIPLQDLDALNGLSISEEALEATYRRVGSASREERSRMPFLEPSRWDTFLPGLAILRAVKGLCRAPSLLVSHWGLREALVLELLLNPLIV